MNLRRVAAIAGLLTAFTGNHCVHAQSPPEQQIYWLHSPQMALSLARQFHLPILVYVASEHCGSCRKMEREVWKNQDVISMVETNFIPLELNAERDAEMIAAMGIRAFPTTLLFTQDAKFVTGAAGYLAPTQLSGLLRSGQRPQVESKQAARQQ